MILQSLRVEQEGCEGTKNGRETNILSAACILGLVEGQSATTPENSFSFLTTPFSDFDPAIRKWKLVTRNPPSTCFTTVLVLIWRQLKAHGDSSIEQQLRRSTQEK
jgi:hypothetical protein